jgi:hypothetical protein
MGRKQGGGGKAKTVRAPGWVSISVCIPCSMGTHDACVNGSHDPLIKGLKVRCECAAGGHKFNG